MNLPGETTYTPSEFLETVYQRHSPVNWGEPWPITSQMSRGNRAMFLIRFMPVNTALIYSEHRTGPESSFEYHIHDGPIELN